MRKKHQLASIGFVLLIGLLTLSACSDTEEVNLSPTATDEPQAQSAGALTGEEIYNGLCVACHGSDAKGMPNLGKDLTVSEFFASSSDAELVAFIAKGRPAAHEDNTTGVDMPPRGGNPSLTDEDLAAVVSYVRALVAQAGGQ